MRVCKSVIVLGSVVLVSGCASQQHAQALKQLESDVSLLDQRVTQLERASLTGASSTPWPSDASATSPASASVAPSAVTVQPRAPAPAAPTLKPTKKEIQQALKNAGFYQGPVDGKMGPKTRDAIRQFQQVNGLKVDGVAGKQTWTKLSAYLDMSASHELGAAESLK